MGKTKNKGKVGFIDIRLWSTDDRRKNPHFFTIFLMFLFFFVFFFALFLPFQDRETFTHSGPRLWLVFFAFCCWWKIRLFWLPYTSGCMNKVPNVGARSNASRNVSLRSASSFVRHTKNIRHLPFPFYIFRFGPTLQRKKPRLSSQNSFGRNVNSKNQRRKTGKSPATNFGA